MRLNKVHIVHCNTLHDGNEDEDGGGDVFSSFPGLQLHDDGDNNYYGDGADEDCNFSSSHCNNFHFREK